jgi:hypothetical protein
MLSLLPLVFLTTFRFVGAQSSRGSGYSGYSLSRSGDAESVGYSTASTPSNLSTVTEPDVYLNASVRVGELDLLVSNLTAKINLDAQVLQLLQFNAGVDLSIDRVSLLIENVTAEVLLEVRLANLVRMIDDTLDSLDLNPVLATVGQLVGGIANATDGLLPSTGSPLTPRSYEVDNNILYSINDYSGNTHTNRVLTRSGSIVDQFLDNNGNINGQQVVGSYVSDMTFNGYDESVVVNGQAARELEYVYAPFAGLSVVSAIYVDAAGSVLSAQVLSESRGGGSSTVGSS